MWGEFDMAKLNRYETQEKRFMQNRNRPPEIVNRSQQKESWFLDFFNTNTMKILGICLLFIILLAIMWGICKYVGDATTAKEIWGMMQVLIPMVFGSMLSTISVSIEIKKQQER